MQSVKRSFSVQSLSLLSSLNSSRSCYARQSIINNNKSTASPAQTGYVGPTSNADPTTGKSQTTQLPNCLHKCFTNPVGVPDTLLVNMWITFPSGEGKFMNGYTVTITKPRRNLDPVSSPIIRRRRNSLLRL